MYVCVRQLFSCISSGGDISILFYFVYCCLFSCLLFSSFLFFIFYFHFGREMSTCFVSPLSTATTPAELFGSHSHQCSSGIQLPAEVAGLRNSIFAFESRDAGAKSTASSAPATETSPKKSRRHSRRSRLGKRFSTTSTVLAKSTITNPNFSQVNYWYVNDDRNEQNIFIVNVFPLMT